MHNTRQDNEQWMSLDQAAAVLGRTPLNVLLLIKRGRLAGVEREEAWLIDPASLAALLCDRAAGDMPTGCHSACARSHGRCGSCA
jgi:hypothetical protein